jgi:hypothetical protein
MMRSFLQLLTFLGLLLAGLAARAVRWSWAVGRIEGAIVWTVVP